MQNDPTVCSLCGHKALLDSLCESCWRSQRITPYDKQIEQTRTTLQNLQNSKLELEARLYMVKAEIYRVDGDALSQRRSVEKWYCYHTNCSKVFQFQSDLKKHVSVCLQEQALLRDKKAARAALRATTRSSQPATAKSPKVRDRGII